MGSLLSRFRKKPTTMEQLKSIEDNLKKIEDFKRNTERKQKRTVASVIIYGAALYVLACVIVVVWYLPESWLVRMGLLIPLFLIPFVIYWMKRLISKYFQSKMVRANEDYADLQRKKKDIIDTVMETETFNKAKEILSKYAPDRLDKKEGIVLMSPISSKTSTTDLRKRTSPNTGTSTTTMRSAVPPKPSQAIIPVSQLSMVGDRPTPQPKGFPTTLPVPRTFLQQHRSFADKLVDFIVGDGPNNRYALICKFCQGHNGMALKEEFAYLAFRCCYCMQYNPARSKRMSAPPLPERESTPALCESPPRYQDLPAKTETEPPEDTETKSASSEEMSKCEDHEAETEKNDSAKKTEAPDSKEREAESELPTPLQPEQLEDSNEIVEEEKGFTSTN